MKNKKKNIDKENFKKPKKCIKVTRMQKDLPCAQISKTSVEEIVAISETVYVSNTWNFYSFQTRKNSKILTEAEKLPNRQGNHS